MSFQRFMKVPMHASPFARLVRTSTSRPPSLMWPKQQHLNVRRTGRALSLSSIETEPRRMYNLREALDHVNPYSHVITVLTGVLAATVAASVFVSNRFHKLDLAVQAAKKETELVEERSKKEIEVAKKETELVEERSKKEIELAKKEMELVEERSKKEIEVAKKEIEVGKKDIEAAKYEMAQRFLLYGYAAEYSRFQKTAGVGEKKSDD